MSDPHEANVQLLLHFDGVEGGTSFPDSSGLGGVWYTTGAPGSIYTTTQSSAFGGSSLRLSNAFGSYFTSDSVPPLGSDDFTLEFWVWRTAEGGGQIYNWEPTPGSPGAFTDCLYISSTGRVGFYAVSAPLSGDLIYTDPIIYDNFWNHVALVRSGDTLSLYANGTRAALYTGLGAYGLTTSSASITADDLWLDEFRITKGVARYSGATYSVPGDAFPDPVGGGTPAVDYIASSIGAATAFGDATSTGGYSVVDWYANGVTLSKGWVNSAVTAQKWVRYGNGADDRLGVYFPTVGAAHILSPIVDFPAEESVAFSFSKWSTVSASFEVRLVPAQNELFNLDGSTLLPTANPSANSTPVTYIAAIPAGAWRFSIHVYLPSPGGYAYVDSVGLPSNFFVAGFSDTQFGTPKEPGLRAEGFFATRLGTPATERRLSLGVVTTFGAHTGRQIQVAAPVIESAQFGTPALTDFDYITDAEGFSVTRHGATHYSIAFSPIGRITVTRAAGWRAMAHGTPTRPVEQTVIAEGFSATAVGTPRVGPSPMARFGAPTSAHRSAAQGFRQTAIGSPASAMVGRVTGWRALQHGQAASVQGRVARPILRAAKFGRAWARVRSHKAFGFSRHGRFGQPRVGVVRYVAASFSCTHFGTAARPPAQRALHIPPDIRFGTALLRRGN